MFTDKAKKGHKRARPQGIPNFLFFASFIALPVQNDTVFPSFYKIF
jgi:hypothetical protein